MLSIKKEFLTRWALKDVNSILVFKDNKIYKYIDSIYSWDIPPIVEDFQYEWIIEGERVIIQYSFLSHHYQIDYNVGSMF